MQREVTTMEKVIVRLTALDYAALLADEDFGTAFCNIAGWIWSHVEHNPGTAYTTEEVAELFSILFNMRHGNSKTPAAESAGESNK